MQEGLGEADWNSYEGWRSCFRKCKEKLPERALNDRCGNDYLKLPLSKDLATIYMTIRSQ